MRSVIARIDLRRAAAILVVGGAVCWGLRLTILEGFVYAWPRGFGGDFAAAMYDPVWWDGTGIMYGPVFVIERWLVNAWPDFLTIRVLAMANAPLIALACALAAAAARCDRTAAVVALAAWLCFRALYIAFSVAANPEILELTLLCLAWYAASRRKPTVACTAAALAVLTKVIPAIFAPLLLLRASRRAVAAGTAAGLIIVLVVGVGQRLGPRELAQAILIPAQNRGGTTKLQIDHIEPVPSSYTMLGLNSALARAASLSDDDYSSLERVQQGSTVLTILLYIASALVAWRVLRGQHALSEVTRLSLSYGLFFALMPLMTLHTHAHTFAFLLPTWTAVIATVLRDSDEQRAALFGVMFSVAYVGTGLPAIVVPLDRRLGTSFALSALFADPIWANLALIASLCGYALLRTRDQTETER